VNRFLIWFEIMGAIPKQEPGQVLVFSSVEVNRHASISKANATLSNLRVCFDLPRVYFLNGGRRGKFYAMGASKSFRLLIAKSTRLCTRNATQPVFCFLWSIFRYQSDIKALLPNYRIIYCLINFSVFIF
jgi:hypothetical protein